MAGGRKVVWILGAGFSKSLGGPLLADLLTPDSNDALKAEYKDVLYGPESPGETLWNNRDTRIVYALAQFGLRPSERGGPIWQDAEHFLDYLDSQTEPETARGDLWNIVAKANRTPVGKLTPKPEILQHIARRIVAAQCCAFLRHNPTSLERWRPYVQWISAMRHSDTIVTFNYDRVVEQVATSPEAQLLLGRGVHVLTHETHRDIGVELDMAKSGDQPVLVKLHGSVDWQHDPTPERRIPYRVSGNKEYAVGAAMGSPLSICTPGGAKLRAASDELRPLWTYAKAKIQEAEAIVFLGYSFPRSDAYARSIIHNAIAANKYLEQRSLNLHTVLGDNPAATKRLASLLDFAAKRSGRSRPNGYQITEHPLFVEDFLSVADFDAL